MKFVADWHDVKAGTEVRLIKETRDFVGNRLLVVERLDGAPIMPNVAGYGRWAYVAPEFLSDAA